MKKNQRHVIAERRKKAEAARRLLAFRYPAVFRRPGDMDKVPLAIGIDGDIMQDILITDGHISKKELKLALCDYANGMSYLKALAIYPLRYNLHGLPVDAVDEEHREHARQQFNKRLSWLHSKGRSLEEALL